MSESVVDPQALISIFGDNTSAQVSILQKFVTQTDELIADFDVAFEQHDAGQIMFHAHKFKSSARTVGANQLADLCFALEQAGREEDWDVINSLSPDLLPAVEQVRQYVNGL